MGCIPSKHQFLAKHSGAHEVRAKKPDPLATPVLESPPPWVTTHSVFVLEKDGVGRYVDRPRRTT